MLERKPRPARRSRSSSAATLKALREPEVIARLQKIGLAPYPQGARQFDDFYRTEIALWGQVVRESGFKTE